MHTKEEDVYEVVTAHRVAVRHLLASPSIEARTRRFVGADEVDWDGLSGEAETMSAGERVLVGIARDLWEASGTVLLQDVAWRLDGRSFERVVEALRVVRGELAPAGPQLRLAS